MKQDRDQEIPVQTHATHAQFSKEEKKKKKEIN